jgi:hypothetical protein
VALLAARDVKKAGYPCAVIDGRLISIDQVAADRPFHYGKHGRSCGCSGHTGREIAHRSPSTSTQNDEVATDVTPSSVS